MNLRFDLGHVVTTEFGVARDDTPEHPFRMIPVDAEVQQALRDITEATKLSLEEEERLGGINPYQPSEKHGATEYLYLPLTDPLAGRIRLLQSAQNLAVDAQGLSDPSAIYAYFARMTDNQGRTLIGLRRATQFKGILKSRVIRIVTDALKLVDDNLFKLDTDFDLLIDPAGVHILRPTGFEFAGALQDAILSAVPKNIKAISRDMTYVDFASIETYAAKHPRAARYLASIRSQRTKNIDKTALKRVCANTNVKIREVGHKITVDVDHIIGFLEVLDRRRYELELIPGSPERFRAASRQKV